MAQFKAEVSMVDYSPLIIVSFTRTDDFSEIWTRSYRDTTKGNKQMFAAITDWALRHIKPALTKDGYNV